MKINSRRVSKFSRSSEEKSPQEMLRAAYKILTERDKEVLLAVYMHRCLTTEQIAEMFFKYDKDGKENSQAALIARRRLRKLYDCHLVDRFFVDVGENNGSSPAHVVLDTLGARIVGGILNMELSELSWRYEMNETRLPYLKHTIGINQFYIHLLRKSREYGHLVSYFAVEQHVRHEFKYWNQKIVVNPDAYGQYWYGDEGFHFFLEWDNGTMTPKTFLQKHQRYTAFYASEVFEQHYENFPLILTVTTTQERAEQLRKSLEKIDQTDVTWLFTTQDQLDNILGTIWLGNDENPVSLL